MQRLNWSISFLRSRLGCIGVSMLLRPIFSPASCHCVAHWDPAVRVFDTLGDVNLSFRRAVASIAKGPSIRTHNDTIKCL
jgi:hypothetical protein